jgi:8-amino-7-oxononanoate synthase
MDLNDRLNSYIQSIISKGNLRIRSFMDGIQLESGICFSNNDYLALSTNQKVQGFYQEGYKRYPTGSVSSNVIFGYQKIHKQLEDAFCEALNGESALLFSSGYAANLGVMALLGRLDAFAVIDKSVHASIYDGLRLSNVHFKRYVHHDINKMQTLLKPDSVVVTEGIFSMSGYQPDIPVLANCVKKHRSIMLLDEAHSFGIVGDNGLGCAHKAKLSFDVSPLRVIPFGKSLASMGAIVVGKKEWIEGLVQAARSNTYSTAISPALCYGLYKTLSVLQQADSQRSKLDGLIQYFNTRKAQNAMVWLDSNTPIQRLVFGCVKTATWFYTYLQTKNIFSQLIRPPTVNVPETGLRFCITARHSEQDINDLFENLEEAYNVYIQSVKMVTHG